MEVYHSSTLLVDQASFQGGCLSITNIGEGCTTASPDEMILLVMICHGLGNPWTEREPSEISRAKDPSTMFIAETWVDEVRLEHILSTTKSLINSDSIMEVAFMDFKELLSWMIRSKQNKKLFLVMFWILGTHPWPILKVKSDDAIFQEQNSVDVVLDMGGGLVLFWRSTIDVIVEGSGTNYIDTMFQEDDRAGIEVIIRECQGKGLAHMVGIIPLPLTVIELETLAISKALQFDADLSLEDDTPEGVSVIAMNALNADLQSLESFGLLSRDVKYFASLFHCIRFSDVRKEGLLYSHIKRNDNGVAHSLAKNALYIPDFLVWMKDVPSHIGSILQLDVVEFY